MHGIPSGGGGGESEAEQNEVSVERMGKTREIPYNPYPYDWMRTNSTLGWMVSQFSSSASVSRGS